MNNEIKEILNDMKIVVEDNDDLFRVDLTLNKEDTKLLLDYITNLQEENERLKKEQLNLKSELANMWECKARNEEAIEYINKNIVINFDKVGFDTNQIAGIVVDKLLELLGGDEE